MSSDLTNCWHVWQGIPSAVWCIGFGRTWYCVACSGDGVTALQGELKGDFMAEYRQETRNAVLGLSSAAILRFQVKYLTSLPELPLVC